MCVIDLFSRKIISWDLGKQMTIDFALQVIERAKSRRELEEPVILHTDRGCQYTSKQFLEGNKELKLSYSKKACPWDNAVIESFHALIKREWLNQFKIKDYDHAYRLIFEYIETFYNTTRIHSHCDYQSPTTFDKIFISNTKQS